MGDSDLPSQNNSCFDSDWNSNQFLSNDEKKTDQKNLDDSLFDQFSNKDNANVIRKTPSSPAGSPTSLFGAHQKDLSYDDLSKNIDANLAEIDMETFRSEDINSILALPAIFTGDFQSASHGEQCASVSGSLLNGLELDASARSTRHSEDEISICKDEPLFSPLREPPVPEATISVDSLDNSSSYDQDLVLTCKANKNNYTIVFEGSSTQFSDDSDYQDVCRSSEGESSMSGAVHVNYSSSFKKQSSMVQSDVAFTTWSKLWKSTRVSRRKSDSNEKISSKSQSLPNLSHNSVFITDKQLTQWAKWCGHHRFPLYEVVQNYHASGMQVGGSKDCLHSISLLKLFMKQRVTSNSSIGSSYQSDSSTSLILQPLNFHNTSLQNSLNISETKIKPLQRNADDTQTNQKEKNRVVNDNDSVHTQMFMDNIQILDWKAVQNMAETNNNNLNQLYNTENNVPDNNNIEEMQVNDSSDDCDNSQCFEDSLMDAQSPPLKHFHATPIKEEEETDISSGDEVMKDSKNNAFGSDESTSGEITVIQNNAVDNVSHPGRQENSSTLERINNIFPSCKSNVGIANKVFSVKREENTAPKEPGVPKENHSQSTQTKHFNINDCPGTEGLRPLQAFSCKTSSNQTDCDTVNTVRYSGSRDSSPTSSGYVSSRHSSVERLKHSSQGNANVASSPVAIQKSNVVVTTSCTCGTQIPVHVKDSSAQTSTLYHSSTSSSSVFTLKESTTVLPEPNQLSQTAVKSPLQSSLSSASQTKPKLHKDKKSIYVCYPNYSLPDLSFLKDVIEENSESIFLKPAEYKLPNEILGHRRPSRPKSYTAYESLLQKQLTKIKDWESLNVLLPDDLKILISKTHPKAFKTDQSLSKEAIYAKRCQQNLSSSYCNADDATKLKTNFSDPSYKRHMPRSILRKSSSVEQCEERHCKIHLPTRCTSASSVIGREHSSSPDAFSLQHKQSLLDAFPRNLQCPDSKCQECSSMKPEVPSKKFPQNLPANIPAELFPPSMTRQSPCSNYKPTSPLMVHPNLSSNLDKKSSFSFENCRDDNLLHEFAGKNLPYSLNNEAVSPSFETKNGRHNMDSPMNCFQGKKAVKFCEKSPTKSSKNGGCCKSGKCCNCDSQNRSPGCHSSQCSCDICNLESEKPSQEYLVSPTQNTLLYPDITDSYTLQNISGGGKFFQEALRRKTGLVENLRKATQLISEHYKSKKGGDPSASFSMGQKILTFLCPAVHTILSDGLLPSVQGFFGPLPNSPWKVAGASIKQGETRKDVEDLLNHVNSEKLLTDSTYRFNAFIIGLLNLGCFEWWLGHLCACQSLICHHYHPTALLSLLALPAAVHLRHELKELVSPLSNLSFNLDLIFETKVSSGDSWKKYSEGNFRPGTENDAKNLKEQEDRNLADLNLQFSPYKHTLMNKINDFSLKSKHNQALSPCTNMMNIRGEAEESHDNQVWPGITINPFPNAKFAEEFNVASQSKKEKNKSNRSAVPFNFLKDTLLPRDLEGKRGEVPHFSLCSSTDSGCSSQVDHINHVAPPANMHDESPNVDVKEGQGFKMLRQKWEKISKPAAGKPPSPKASKPTISSSSKAKKKTEASPPRSAHREAAVPKTPTKSVFHTPPARRAQGKGNLYYGSRSPEEAVIQPESSEKRKSGIPTLKFNKSPGVRSMIPVQKVGTRAKSASRDPRFSSD